MIIFINHTLGQRRVQDLFSSGLETQYLEFIQEHMLPPVLNHQGYMPLISHGWSRLWLEVQISTTLILETMFINTSLDILG